MEIDEKQIFSIIQKAKESGKVRIGANEATKSLERGEAKLIVCASDVSPAEIVAHFEGLSKEMKAIYVSMGTKAELGSAVGIKSTTAIAVADAGGAKKELEALQAEMQKESKKEETPKKEEKVEEKPAKKEEAPAEEEVVEEESKEEETKAK